MPQTLGEIRALLAARGLRPRHRFGQNFLHDKNVLAKLVEAASIAPGDVVLEVGPGTGTLTEALLDAGAVVVACEIDRDLAAILAERLGPRITLVVGDCLEKGRRLGAPVRAALAGRPFTLVANLPYNVASALVTALLVEDEGCRGLYVTIQREVADRLLAPPGTREYGPLGVIVAAVADVRRVATVPASCFWPEPEVTSAMVAIVPSEARRPADPRAFARFVTALFGKRRKQIGAILGRDRPLPPGVTGDLRPEALTIVQLVALHALAE
jgi:16S rRNA (adenine1518-N6/adenine1519-N6)-dimethyltransferase